MLDDKIEHINSIINNILFVHLFISNNVALNMYINFKYTCNKNVYINPY